MAKHKKTHVKTVPLESVPAEESQPVKVNGECTAHEIGHDACRCVDCEEGRRCPG